LPNVCCAGALGPEGPAGAATARSSSALLRGARSARRARIRQAGPVPVRGEHFWSKRGAGPRSSSAVPFQAPSSFPAAPAWTWPNERHEQVRHSPVIDADMNIYVGTTTRVLKLGPDGSVLWTFERPALKLATSPALEWSSILLLFQDTDPEGVGRPTLFSLALSTGSVEWSRRFPEYGHGGDAQAMLAHAGIVYFGVTSARAIGGGSTIVVAASAYSGDKLWEYEADEVMWNFTPSTPGDGTLLFSSSCGAVFRLGSAGQLLWRAGGHHGRVMCTTAGGALGPNGIFYAEFREGPSILPTWGSDVSDTLAAYRVSDGSLLWRRQLPYRAIQYPSVGRLGPDGPLAVVAALGDNPMYPMSAEEDATLLESVGGGGLRNMVVAMDAATGETLWTSEDERWNSSFAAGELDPHNPADGSMCWPDAQGIPMIAGDGTVFASSGLSGSLRAIRDADGDGIISPSEVSTLNTRQAFLNSPSLAPSMLVVAPCWGPMYVFRE